MSSRVRSPMTTLPAGGVGLQSGRDVRRVAEGREVVELGAADVADEGRPRVDADTEARSVRRGRRGSGPLEGQCGAAGPERVIGLAERGVEDGHEGIAHELDDRAALGEDGRHGPPEGGVEHRHDHLRRAPVLPRRACSRSGRRRARSPRRPRPRARARFGSSTRAWATSGERYWRKRWSTRRYRWSTSRPWANARRSAALEEPAADRGDAEGHGQQEDPWRATIPRDGEPMARRRRTGRRRATLIAAATHQATRTAMAMPPLPPSEGRGEEQDHAVLAAALDAPRSAIATNPLTPRSEAPHPAESDTAGPHDPAVITTAEPSERRRSGPGEPQSAERRHGQGHAHQARRERPPRPGTADGSGRSSPPDRRARGPDRRTAASGPGGPSPRRRRARSAAELSAPTWKPSVASDAGPTAAMAATVTLRRPWRSVRLLGRVIGSRTRAPTRARGTFSSTKALKFSSEWRRARSIERSMNSLSAILPKRPAGNS